MSEFEEVFKKENLIYLKNNLLALRVVLEDKLKKEEKEILDLYSALPEMLYNEQLIRDNKE
jgi:hypothetical protein